MRSIELTEDQKKFAVEHASKGAGYVSKELDVSLHSVFRFYLSDGIEYKKLPLVAARNKRVGKRYSEREICFIIDNAHRGYGCLSFRLGRTKVSLQRLAYEIGIQVERKKRKNKKLEGSRLKNYLIAKELVSCGILISQVADSIKIPRSVIYKWKKDW